MTIAPTAHTTTIRRAEPADLDTLVVDPTHRGAGIGRRLLDALVAARDELGIHRLMLKATDMGRPLYESAGFTNPPYLLELT